MGSYSLHCYHWCITPWKTEAYNASKYQTMSIWSYIKNFHFTLVLSSTWHIIGSLEKQSRIHDVNDVKFHMFSYNVLYERFYRIRLRYYCKFRLNKLNLFVYLCYSFDKKNITYNPLTTVWFPSVISYLFSNVLFPFSNLMQEIV